MIGYLVPVGDADRELLQKLRHELIRRFSMPFEPTDPVGLPEEARSRSRSQYDAASVLDHLRHHASHAGGVNEVRVLGITGKDLYVEGLNFVFGLADMPGKYALVSTARLRQEYYGFPADETLFFERVVKEAVHELGHTFGLRHCPNASCVMHFSNSIADTDGKSTSFCPQCAGRLTHMGRAPARKE